MMSFEKLNKIFSIQKGKKNNLIDDPDNSSVRLLQIDDLRNDSNIKYTNDAKGLLVNEEDILIAWDGANVGTVGYGKKGYLGSTLAQLKVINNNKYHSRYLGLFLKTKSDYFKKNSTGATIPHIHRKSLENLLIPIPENLTDQIRIAEVLNKTETLIKQRKESIDLLDDFLRSTFLDMFGDPVKNEKKWEKVPLNKYGKIITGNTPPRNNLNNFSEDHIEWIKTDNILSEETFVTKSKEYLSKEGLSKSRFVTKGALLVACIAGSIESVGRASLTDRKVSFNQQINAIQPNDNINSYFLYWLFKISKVYIQNHSTKGMKKILTKGIFEKILMIKPSIELQSKFASIVEKTENVKENYKVSLNELENLFGSLSQKAFKGELDLSKLDVSAQIREIEQKIEEENGLDISIETKLTKSMQVFIKQTSEIQKKVNSVSNILSKSMLKQIESINKSSESFQNLNKIPEQLANSLKAFEGIQSIANKLNKEASKQIQEKLTWEEVNFSQVAQWINNTYKDYNFNFEMLFNFLVNEHVTFPNYYSSEELKTNPKLVESDDLKSFIFSALNNQNQFIKLEQFFYDTKKENVPLKLRQDDYEKIKNKEKELCSGIYFKIVE